ncbi:tonB-system energizer ExbB [Metapseudomonas otitidis]|uniref:tonB-system energizer ExbB n=1 Tax=Metapseudomonas otitidis TaxID=319939 RepID=UPI0013F62B6A|nr:tonB-system energizer ExbB [Pseudomonas otitidis]
MKPIAPNAQPASLSRRARPLAALLLGLALLPAGAAFAEEPTAAPVNAAASTQPAATPAVATPAATPVESVQAGAGAPSAPTNAELLSTLQALGPQATPEQIRDTARQTLQAQGVAPEEIDKTLAAIDQGLSLGNDLAAALAGTTPEAVEESLPAHDLSPWGMYQNADIVVKGVMIGLVLASILTWTIWLAKSIELLGAKRRLRRELVALKAARNLPEAADKTAAPNNLSQVLVQDALDELKLSTNTREKDGIKERVSFRLERLVAASGRKMSMGTGVLATIGSTAPFVGLFGTVWGIMNSFIGIAKSQTTNLAVVAPGIAEALLATAMGLVAAIPAVVIYNVFARSITGYKAQVADASAQVLLLVSRDLDHAPADRAPAPHMVKVG